MKMISPQQLKELIDSKADLQIIDIREPEKFAEAHIGGAVSLPQKDIPAKIDQISRSAMVVILCAYGMKSDQVYLYLKEKHKFKNIYILEGGLYDYARDVDPTIQVL